jgi:hypothetical protein
MTAITGAEILLKRSITTGAAGNAAAQPDPNASLGKYVSTTDTPASGANTIFDDISGAENAASTSDYRCLFAHNTNASNILVGAKVWISAEVAGGASVSIASDNIAASAVGSASAQAAVIASETTAPTGVSAFSAPTTVGTGVALGDIGINQVKGFWLKRTAANTAALSGDGVTIAVGGDTGSL